MMKFWLKEKKYGWDEASRSKTINNIRAKQMEDGDAGGRIGGGVVAQRQHMAKRFPTPHPSKRSTRPEWETSGPGTKSELVACDWATHTQSHDAAAGRETCSHFFVHSSLTQVTRHEKFAARRKRLVRSNVFGGFIFFYIDVLSARAFGRGLSHLVLLGSLFHFVCLQSPA